MAETAHASYNINKMLFNTGAGVLVLETRNCAKFVRNVKPGCRADELTRIF